jgi:septum formation protein
MMSPPLLILASRSPRRRELLTTAGYRFRIVVPDEEVECGVCSQDGPAGLVAELAFRKAAAVVRQLTSMNRQETAAVLGADTVAECGGMILGKPRDMAEARTMLTQLSGREHRVLTGVCLWRLGSREPLVRVAVTKLRMDVLTNAQINEYLAGGQWEGKAGAFGYQDGLGWVHLVEGSESNVVGLPMDVLAEMLLELEPRNSPQ